MSGLLSTNTSTRINAFVSNDIEPMAPQYGYTDETIKEHEAGYDSFMTGVCFLGLVRKLNINNKDISSKSPQLRPLLNKWVQIIERQSTRILR